MRRRKHKLFYGCPQKTLISLEGRQKEEEKGKDLDGSRSKESDLGKILNSEHGLPKAFMYVCVRENMKAPWEDLCLCV